MNGITNVATTAGNIITSALKDEIESGSCKLIKDIFEKMADDDTFINKYKALIEPNVSKIITQITDDLKAKYEKDEAGPNAGPEGGPEGGPESDANGDAGVSGGSRKRRVYRKTKRRIKGGQLHKPISKKRSAAKYSHKHTNKNKSKHSHKNKNKRGISILTSVKQECTCTGPQGCTCIESRESIRDPPMVGGTPCDGAI